MSNAAGVGQVGPVAVSSAEPLQPLPPGAMALRPMDVEIFAAAAANILGDKVKDAIRKRPWKVNLYKENGAPLVNRLKIDLDRDDKWDEKWSWDPEGLKRQVAPADDEKYSEETWYRQDLNAWANTRGGVGVPLAEAPGAAAPGAVQTPVGAAAAPLPTGGEALRPMDQEILAAVAANISGDKVKDAIRGYPWKVNLYKDAGFSAVNRLKIDLDRDDKWDEKWTWEPGGVKREIAPLDDDVYTRSFFRPDGGSAWLPR